MYQVLSLSENITCGLQKSYHSQKCSNQELNKANVKGFIFLKKMVKMMYGQMYIPHLSALNCAHPLYYSTFIIIY